MEVDERELIENIKMDIKEICGSSSTESVKLVKSGINFLLNSPCSEEFHEVLKTYETNFSYNAECSNSQRHRSSIKAAFRRLEGVLFLDDAWGKALNSYIEKNKKAYDFLASVDDIYLDIPSGKPTKKWLARLEEVIESYGKKDVREMLANIINLLINETLVVKAGLSYSNEKKIYTILNAYKGLAQEADASLVKALTLISYSKVPYIGSVSTSIGNLCLEIMEAMDGTAGLVALSDLSIELKYPANAKKQALKKLESGAKKKGVSVEDLKDQIVPDFGLS